MNYAALIKTLECQSVGLQYEFETIRAQFLKKAPIMQTLSNPLKVLEAYYIARRMHYLAIYACESRLLQVVTDEELRFVYEKILFDTLHTVLSRVEEFIIATTEQKDSASAFIDSLGFCDDPDLNCDKYLLPSMLLEAHALFELHKLKYNNISNRDISYKNYADLYQEIPLIANELLPGMLNVFKESRKNQQNSLSKIHKLMVAFFAKELATSPFVRLYNVDFVKLVADELAANLQMVEEEFYGNQIIGESLFFYDADELGEYCSKIGDCIKKTNTSFVSIGVELNIDRQILAVLNLDRYINQHLTDSIKINRISALFATKFIEYFFNTLIEKFRLTLPQYINIVQSVHSSLREEEKANLCKANFLISQRYHKIFDEFAINFSMQFFKKYLQQNSLNLNVDKETLKYIVTNIYKLDKILKATYKSSENNIFKYLRWPLESEQSGYTGYRQRTSSLRKSI